MSNLVKILADKKICKSIWFMRQAGRYLPEFKKIRASNQNFIELCLNSELSAEITLQPIKRFDIDSAIIFSDILMVPYALGQNVKFIKDYGPKLSDFSINNFLDNDKISFTQKLHPVYKAIEITRKKLDKKKSLIKEQNLSVIEIDFSKYYKSDYYSPEKTKELEEYLRVIFKKDWTYKSEDYYKYNDVRFNWISLKNENQLILNRKNRFVKTFKKKLSRIYELYNNEFIHILNDYRNVLDYMKDRELKAKLSYSEYNDITNRLTSEMINHFKEMYIKSDLYNNCFLNRNGENSNKESTEDFIKRMTSDDDIIY